MDSKQKTEEKVFSYMEEHHMLKAQEKVVAGVSGGADSVCLLFLLLAYRKRVPFSLAVVHVHHGIRREADADAAYVEALCKQQEIPFYLFREDVRQRAKQEKCSEEEAGRLVRYQAFARIAEELGATKIAVAHNANDRSETMLFHLFRGSSIKGLSGIRPVRDRIIRPILCLEREEVESYLEEQQIAYCQDATNQGDDYTRNRIRHHILPYAREHIVSGCVAHMNQTADMLADTEDYLEQQTAAAMEACVAVAAEQETRGVGCQKSQAERVAIDVERFLDHHSVIRNRILYKIITGLAGSERDITQIHVRDALSLFLERDNRTICLPYGIQARRQYDKVILERGVKTADRAVEERALQESAEVQRQSILMEANCEISLPGGERLECKVIEQGWDLSEIPTNPYTKWFDYDKIEKSWVLRTRESGDYLSIAGGDGQLFHKSLKTYMVDEKIPKNERDSLLLLAEGNHVIWLIGYRISEYYKVDRNTKRVLQVQLIGKGCQGNKTEEENG